MLKLDDPLWRELVGGYRVPYDASIPLRRMEAGESVWSELWENLHHQGDVAEASYAALPHMVRICEARGTDWNLYALAATIEVERHRTTNPPIPDWLVEPYRAALDRLVQLALRDLSVTSDELMLRNALSVVPLGRGDLKLGALLTYMEEDELTAYVEEHLAWSKLYA
jgi:hypothetical protein